VTGECIIERQIRQVRARSEGDIRVVTHQPQIAQVARDLDVDSFHPEARHCTCETFLSARQLWGDRTLVLLGDVIFSRYAMDVIADNQADLAVFGSIWEIYAVKFSRELHDRIVSVLEEQIAVSCGPAVGKMRQFYERYCDLPNIGHDNIDVNHPPPPDTEGKVMVWIQDYTNDVDTPEEYAEFQRRVVGWDRLDDMAVVT
jgi:hypothetical protein